MLDHFTLLASSVCLLVQVDWEHSVTVESQSHISDWHHCVWVAEAVAVAEL